MGELDLVVLLQPYPEVGLTAGDVGVIVHVYREGRAFEVEFLTGHGRTLAVLTLSAQEVRPLAQNEVLHARRLPAAA